jgi:hypothetical protein
LCHLNDRDHVGGVHIVVYPLLVLTMIQVAKFLYGSERFGPIIAHNLGDYVAPSGKH